AADGIRSGGQARALGPLRRRPGLLRRALVRLALPRARPRRNRLRLEPARRRGRGAARVRLDGDRAQGPAARGPGRVPAGPADPPAEGRGVTPILCAIFLVSGAAALLYETLWFRGAGLLLGNSVWASSLVLSSFMGGLALGNGIAARYGARALRPIRVYA